MLYKTYSCCGPVYSIPIFSALQQRNPRLATVSHYSQRSLHGFLATLTFFGLFDNLVRQSFTNDQQVSYATNTEHPQVSVDRIKLSKRLVFCCGLGQVHV